MKIKNLKINAFGNLKDKEIEFSDHINIVYGNNESGKSTLLKFIDNIFYGTSKTKKGREFSDYDTYKPWHGEEFSGKLSYSLDNGQKFEVFRDFSSKNPKIYNENLEDISKDFTIDKTYGNLFFTEQTGMDESTFLSTLVSMQQEVKIDQNSQNSLLQKIANMVGSGDDNISYKKALEKLSKKQLDEIGTARSQGRPINLIKEEKFDIQDEIGELENYKIRKQEIENEKLQKQEELKVLEQNLLDIKEEKSISDKQTLEQEKIKIKESLSQKQNKTFRNISLVLVIVGLVLAIISIVIKNTTLMIVSGIELILSLSWCLVETRKLMKSKHKSKHAKVTNIVESLQTDDSMQDKLDKLQDILQKKKLEYYSLELEENNINPKLERIALLEEKIEELNQKEFDLEKQNNSIELSKEILEIAYSKMKQSVTPKLTEELSNIIYKISNGKYDKIALHEEKGMIVQNQKGEYIELEKLSKGTIDQLYLSLRLLLAKELSTESMPIILDEAFAYYDDERLINILNYINTEFIDNQVIIFTCTNREKSILDNMQISYNYINL